MGGYAGRHRGVGGVDGEGVGGAVGVGVVEDHLGELERFGEVCGYGGADEAAGKGEKSAGGSKISPVCFFFVERGWGGGRWERGKSRPTLCA